MMLAASHVEDTEAGASGDVILYYRGSIGLEHSDGVREPSVDEDRPVSKAGEDEERDLALFQRCCGSIVVALLVSTATVSAPYRGSIGLEHSDGVREPSVDEDRPVSKAGEDEERDLALFQRCCGSIVVALLVSTATVSAPYRGSIGLEHSDGVREPSVDEDRPVSKAGEDEERDLALFQRCCGSIVVALLVSTATVSAPYRGSIGLEHSDGVREPSVDEDRPVSKAGEDEERDLALFQRCCGSIVVALLVSTATVSAPYRGSIGLEHSDGVREPSVDEDRPVSKAGEDEERDLALFQRCCGSIVVALLVSTATVSAPYRGSIGLEHSDGVREPSVDEDRPVSKAGEDEERDLALFQRCCGSIVVALLVSTATVSAPYRGSIGLEHSDGVREPSVDEDRPVSKAGEDEERDLALFQRCCGSIVVALLVSTATVSAPYRGSIGLEHSDGVREPSVDEDRPVSKAGEDEERDLALFQRCCGSIVVALLVSTATVSAPYRGSIGLEHSDGVREPSVDEDRPVSKAGEDEERDLALFQRCCGSIVVALLVSTATVSAPYRGSIGLEHSDGVREPSVDEDRPVRKAGEDEERDLALFQRCCGSIVVALLVSTATVSAPYRGSIGLEHSDGVREPSVDEDRPVRKAGEDEERDLALFQRCCGSIVVALLVSTATVSAPYRGSIGLEHSDGVREPSVDEDRPVRKAGEDEERDLALFQRCCGSIVVALLVSTATVSAPYRGSIGLEHSDGVREPSVDEDRPVRKAGEDEERDLALFQRCCGSIVVALLVSTATVSAPPRRGVAWSEPSVAFDGSTEAGASGDVILYVPALPSTDRRSIAAPSAWSTATACESLSRLYGGFTKQRTATSVY
ncbi:hypothetical protein PHYSODRAFT_341371 [Phytophthora sojae]|uniref:Uncharacterized protein n=1 Tax=Phytophthora sojae (strain P6497) TaxID=1094619 RepID=G5AD10_PHYSP|nr:hypothetical protein PHYSODRAFT_341371 [Phytophthora sojae]EGZ06064.1 hypothetical protein PHYSODRAFT_341371 [Phytophthora sojae]|eukprot:XP_009537961.1 hypothetical protein PHYSODRAFT_341371 [Phytophthora sojae]